MSDNTVEEFEKVDSVPEMEPEEPNQDEVVTSTSITGDAPEEDRYEGSPSQNTGDLLGDFGGGIDSNYSEVSNTQEPLIEFESPVQEPPVMEFSPPRPTVTESTTNSTKTETVSMPSEGGFLKNVDPRVLELIYWRDVKKTGVVFGSMMFVLLSLSMCSLLSVLAYLSLAILTVTFSFRIYKNVMQAVQKTNEGHPFKKLLEMDIELREDVVQNAAEKIACNINCCSRELRRMYLVGDYIDSLKFGLLLWLLTYVGAWFNGMTLVILAVVSIFTLPKVYETYQGPIDQNVNLVRNQLNNIMAQVSAKIPFPKKKVKAQ